MRVLSRFATMGGVALLCVSAGACSVAAGIRLSGTLERPEAVVTDIEDGGPWRRACVDRIEVWREGDPRSQRHWAIEVDGDDCIWLTRIAYGEVPEGFVERAAPGPLEAGVRFEVFAHGWTRGFASVPWVAGGNYIFENGAWRPAAS